MPHQLSQPGNDLDVLRLDAQLTPEEILVRDTTAAFAAERDTMYVWFTLIVLAILAYSLLAS